MYLGRTVVSVHVAAFFTFMSVLPVCVDCMHVRTFLRLALAVAKLCFN